MSKYLDGLSAHHNSGVYLIGFTDYMGGVHKKGHSQVTRTVTVGSSIQEEVYKDFTLVTQTVEREWAYLFDEDGTPMTGNYYTNTYPNMERGVAGEWTRFKESWSYAWKTGVEIPESLQYYNSGAVFWKLYPSDSPDKSIKKAKARLDMETRGEERRSVLRDLAVDRLQVGVEPYNVRVNDRVWVQSLGKLRHGVVVQTQGRKFVVAYLVPNNLSVIRYKSVPLSAIRIDKGYLENNQEHNFQKVGN